MKTYTLAEANAIMRGAFILGAVIGGTLGWALTTIVTGG